MASANNQDDEYEEESSDVDDYESDELDEELEKVPI